MPPLPERVPATLKAIHKARLEANPPILRGYGVGMSEAHNPCPRAIWYGLHWASPPEEHSPRMLRLFETGNIEEERFLNDLEQVPGINLMRSDPATGRQWKVSIAGFINGKMDAVVLGLPEAPKTWHVVECKSANTKTFTAIKRKGVERGKPEHWVQMQLYMLETGMDRALYMLVNKDTDEEYVERVRFNRTEAERVCERLITIAKQPKPPAKLHADPDKPTAFQCRFCRHLATCHRHAFALSHCRTCLHSEFLLNGVWWCTKHDKELTIEEQKEGCPDHRFIPDLVPGEQVDVLDGDKVVYELLGGALWVDGESANDTA